MPFLFQHPLGLFNKADLLAYTGDDYALNFCKNWFLGQEYFSFFSSGSTGKPKEISLHKDQMIWSATASKKAFALKRTPNLFLCLQAEVIGASMMLVRAMCWDCEIKLVSAQADPMLLLDLNHPYSFISLVPYQLENILDNPESIKKLNQFELLLLGGASIESSLQLKINKYLSIKCLHSYGMTETSSHIALKEVNPRQENYFSALEGVKLSINDNGCLRIESPSALISPLDTNDLVAMENVSQFRILGRADMVVNSGAVKILIEEIEKLSSEILTNQGYKIAFLLWKKKDEVLGERLVMLVEGETYLKKEDEILSLLKNELPKYKAPKEIIFVGSFARSASGKVLREESLFKHGKK